MQQLTAHRLDHGHGRHAGDHLYLSRPRARGENDLIGERAAVLRLDRHLAIGAAVDRDYTRVERHRGAGVTCWRGHRVGEIRDTNHAVRGHPQATEGVRGHERLFLEKRPALQPLRLDALRRQRGRCLLKPIDIGGVQRDLDCPTPRGTERPDRWPRSRAERSRRIDRDCDGPAPGADRSGALRYRAPARPPTPATRRGPPGARRTR